MSRTITALFDTREDAEAGKARLQAANCDPSNVHIHDRSSTREGASQSASDRQSLWSSTKNAPPPHEDRHAYEEGLRRGGYLLTADVDEDQVDSAVRALEETNSVDFDQRQSEWRSSGWKGYDQRAGAGAGTSSNAAATGAAAGTSDRAVQEERIPVVEEELRVGKREVERGGAKVRSYVQETPVQEQVSLREEHVSIERRPVDRTLSSSEIDQDSDLLRERSVEMTEKAEEAVVEKEARVREELVVRKTAEERTEQINETVRHTEVEVDEGLQKGGRTTSDAGRHSGLNGSQGDFENDKPQ